MDSFKQLKLFWRTTMNKFILVAIIAGISGIANAKIDDNHQQWIDNPLSVVSKVSQLESKTTSATLASIEANPYWADTAKKN